MKLVIPKISTEKTMLLRGEHIVKIVIKKSNQFLNKFNYEKK